MSGIELDPTLVATLGGPPPGLGAAFAPGSQVAARYRIVKFVGAGAAGEVYEADDLLLGMRVALKVVKLPESPAMARLELQRFVREIALARKVTHPNVCRVHDVGEHAGRAFLTMEFLVGETLADRLRRGRLMPGACERIAQDLVAGLAALHAQNIVHRDFKSSNVMLACGERGERAVITDFGLAKSTMVESGADLTGGATLLGTPAYMAPEQVEGRPATFASDVYAFGVVLFEMLTGTLPFVEATALGTAAARLTRDAPRASERVPAIPKRWDEVVAHCLERDPARRPATVHDVLLPTHRRRRGAIVAGLGALVALGIAAMISHETPRQQLAAPAACESAATKLAGIWDPATRAQAAARFAASPKDYVHATWHTLAAQLDAMTAEWARLWTQACAANDRVSDPLLYGQRLSCLESDRMELRAYASSLGNPSIDIETFAIGAPAQFPITPPSACSGEPYLRGQVPLPPIASRRAIDALMMEFHRLRERVRFATFEGSIDPEPVFAALTQLESRAAALGYPAGQAEIEFWHGIFLTWFGRADEANVVADRMLQLAEQTRDDPRQVMALALRVDALTARPAGYDAASAEAALARADEIATRLGRPRHMLEWIEEARVEHLARLHDPGIASRQRLIELREGWPNYVLWAQALLGKVRAWNGDAVEALPAIKAMLAERERFGGSWSLPLGAEQMRQSPAFAYAGDLRGALEHAERAVTIFEPAFRDHSGDSLWAAHLNAAGYAARLGAGRAAEEHVRAAVRDAVVKGASELVAYARSIRELRRHGHRLAAELAARDAGRLQGSAADTAVLARERDELVAEAADLGAGLGDPRAAVVLVRGQLQAMASTPPWDNPDRGDLEARLGIALLESGDLDAAIEHLQEAIWIHGSCCWATAVIAQDARFALARALWQQGDRPTARRYARLAHDQLATMGPALAAKTRVTATWLAAHP